MPRKAVTTEKPPLLFLERALSGARLQNVPEVRAALNPKEFFTGKHDNNSSAQSSWVSPQFDSSVAAPTLRRGRRKCHSATNVLQSFSQLSKKSSVCKFPSLTFQTRSRDEPHQTKSLRKKKAIECTVVSEAGNQPQGSCQIQKTASSTRYLDTPKRQTTSVRKRNARRCSDGAGSSSRYLDQPGTPSIQVTEKCGIPSNGASTPASNEFSGLGPPPDLDTPKVMQEGSSYPSFNSPHLLLPQSSTPPCNHPPDILVADTPERDYGVKVTWRRRRDLMLLLKERGLLSDSEVESTPDIKYY